MTKVLASMVVIALISIMILINCGGGGTANPTPSMVPVANAGPDQNKSRDTVVIVTLDGSMSSSPNGTLTYLWSFTSKPAGSTATLSSSTAVNPTFTADKDGAYILSLIVNNGSESSVPDSVTIIVNNTAKAITAFSFNDIGIVGVINENNKTIALDVPYGTSVTASIATFSTTGVTVKVASIVQQSGITPNDFTNTVNYTVTAADSSYATYTVTVTVMGYGGCSPGYLYCSSSITCCPSGYPYHCGNSCYSSIPLSAPCNTTYDICTSGP